MRPLYIALILLLNFQLEAQISITVSDLPESGDVYYISNANPFEELELGVTGADMLWNYNFLSPIIQDSSVWVAPTETNPAYFFLWFDADIAEETGQTIDSEFFTLEDIYNFYKKTTSEFSITGQAGTITGIPFPIGLDDDDVVLELPLNYGDTYSSESGFNFDIPGIGSWQETRSRTCEVDGWGSITTPLDTYEALRVKCVVDIEDVFSAEGIEVPIAYTTNEYRWMSPDEGIPVLQVNTQSILGLETVTAVIYKDTLVIPTSIETQNSNGGLSLQSNIIQNGTLQLVSHGGTNRSVATFITDINGQQVAEALTVQVAGGTSVSIPVGELSFGMYLLICREENGAQQVFRFLIAE
jgi:hypothetical protein